MSDGSMNALQMLAQRLQIVQEISTVQSRNLLNRQLGGGAEFEIEGIEQQIAASGCSRDLAKTLADARERLRKANAEMAECDARCSALGQRLEELDRCIAASR